MKVLVTGGAGFIGSHLCEKLSQDGHEVFSLDDYSTGTKENHVNNVTYITGETKNIEALVNITPDIIYHLGEYSRVEQSFDDVEKVWNSNKDGTFAVLQFCRKTKAKIVYAGSSTKFADNGQGSSQSPYAWSKASNTELVKNYGNWFGITYAVVYFYNVYGGREISSGKYATLIAICKEKYKKKLPLTVVSPGTQLRNFTHIDDIISGLVMVGEKGCGDDFGIGIKESFSILEVAKMFKSEIETLPERKGNRMTGKVVTCKTEKLGWVPKNKLKDHISKFIKNHSL